MNKQIGQLAAQARIRDHWSVDEGRYLTNYLDEAKFAELIIRECLDQCYNRGMNDELYAGQLKAASFIEQHFGVEP